MLYISTFSLRFTIKSYSCRITTFSFSHFLGKTYGSMRSFSYLYTRNNSSLW